MNDELELRLSGFYRGLDAARDRLLAWLAARRDARNA